MIGPLRGNEEIPGEPEVFLLTIEQSKLRTSLIRCEFLPTSTMLFLLPTGPAVPCSRRVIHSPVNCLRPLEEEADPMQCHAKGLFFFRTLHHLQCYGLAGRPSVWWGVQERRVPWFLVAVSQGEAR